jgi:hypothetical protein
MVLTAHSNKLTYEYVDASLNITDKSMQRNAVEELFTLLFSSFVLLIQQRVKAPAKLTDVSE